MKRGRISRSQIWLLRRVLFFSSYPRRTLVRQKNNTHAITLTFSPPRSYTAGCTNQACGFRDSYPDFTSLNFDVYCLSADSPTAQNKWQTKVIKRLIFFFTWKILWRQFFFKKNRKSFLILWFLTRSESLSLLWEQVKVERRRGVISSSRREVNLWTRNFLFHQRIGEGLFLNVPIYFFQSINAFLMSSPKLALEFVKSL